MAAGAVTTVDDALRADGRGPAATLTCPVLAQRISRVAGGARLDVRPEGSSEILFVAAGGGTLRAAGEEHRLALGTGVFVGDGEAAELEAAGGSALDVVRVELAPAEPTGSRVARYEDQPVQDAGIGREFRLLAGCTEATQFVGVVPPGRARMHNHPYDEVAYLIEGEGMMHWEDGTSVPVGAGSCIYFPRLVFHSLENLGSAPLRIMGVFHPAGSPADRVAVLDY